MKSLESLINIKNLYKSCKYIRTQRRFIALEDENNYAWKKWINFDSKYQDVTDKLNRMRHYHYYVDGMGRLWRKEIDKENKLFGQLKEPLFLDKFYANIRNNDTGRYVEYPFVTTRGPDTYFIMAKHSPIVFYDLKDDHLVFAGSYKTKFKPENLYISPTDQLYHPVNVPIRESDEVPPREILGLIERNLSYQLLSQIDEKDGRLWIKWENEEYPVGVMEDDLKNSPNNHVEPTFIRVNTKWWKEE
eukprot:TRINITY_DN6080_c0_g1_i1.p1 TRINITY_DN6080_c0_g1~~TRINITY_DN6080_c0_g1_i1.p1  ORF type:complete len:246 (+),score=45.58 TRINITY_DN6080_c0_g1_i1:107-844(+)